MPSPVTHWRATLPVQEAKANIDINLEGPLRHRAMRVFRTRSSRRQTSCNLCSPQQVVLHNEHAYARYDTSPLCEGHMIVMPRRHVAGFFEMTVMEHTAVSRLLRQAHAHLVEKFSPDGFNTGVNVGGSGRPKPDARACASDLAICGRHDRSEGRNPSGTCWIPPRVISPAA
jgi:hypothetical protein